jgi:hypothetical protein
MASGLTQARITFIIPTIGGVNGLMPVSPAVFGIFYLQEIPKVVYVELLGR